MRAPNRLGMSAKDYGLDIAGNIKRRREEIGLSLQDVANATGLSKAYVWDLERGHADNPSICALLAVSGVLKMTLAQILGADIAQPLLSQEELELVQQHRRIFGRQ